MIKTGDPDSAAANLRFLLEAGLIVDSALKPSIGRFLERREPGRGPALPTPAGEGVEFLDGGVMPVSELPAGPLATAAEAVGRLLVNGQFACTAFLVATDIAMTIAECLTRAEGAELEMGATRYHVTLPALEIEAMSLRDPLTYALVHVSGAPGDRHGTLTLSTNPPRPDDPAALIMYRTGDDQKLVSNCVVVDADDSTFTHQCETGPGSSGAPMIGLLESDRVLGVHGIGRASRADAIAVRSQLLSRP